MKTIIICVALLTSSVFGFSFEEMLKEGAVLPEVVGSSHGVESGGRVRGTNSVDLMDRDLGSKGAEGPKGGPGGDKGSKGPKGGPGGDKGSKGSSDCHVMKVFTKERDYTIHGKAISSIGQSLDGVPLYQKQGGKQIGLINEVTIDTKNGDCSATGSISVGQKNSTAKASSEYYK
jgi:hypothetical protein